MWEHINYVFYTLKYYVKFYLGYPVDKISGGLTKMFLFIHTKILCLIDLVDVKQLHS